MQPMNKRALKNALGQLPWTAEMYWRLLQRGQPLSDSFSLERTAERLPGWLADLQSGAAPPTGRRILLFATLRYWIEHAVLLGLALRGLGHRVSLLYLPVANWHQPLNNFDLRRQNIYSRSILNQAHSWLPSTSLLDLPGNNRLPADLQAQVQAVSERDVQYSLQIESVDPNSPLYRLRFERNSRAAAAAYRYMQSHRPDIVITPNGSILEMGMVYQAARHLDLPVVTYEFGEQRDRIWLAQNSEVMRQETDAMWSALGSRSLSEAELGQIRELFSSRQQADLWGNFSRRWQGQPAEGGEAARLRLGLDSRPVVLLAANVIGDSLTLARQVFTSSMSAWLEQTTRLFAALPDVQLVIRIHPGERYTRGPSVADLVEQVLPERPPHIHLIQADDPTNTYDLVEIADLGLVYTTTVGMEMAMSGVPVLVSGQTHYRGKGFTLDPDTWNAYESLLLEAVYQPEHFRLSREQVLRAWQYAYRFFFDYPQPFPWHLLHCWEQLEAWPLARALSPEGREKFGTTFRYLMGEPLAWQSESAYGS